MKLTDKQIHAITFGISAGVLFGMMWSEFGIKGIIASAMLYIMFANNRDL